MAVSLPTPVGTLSILIVEDEPDLAEALAHTLGRAYEVAIANSVGQARAAIARQHFDAVITDFNLGGETAQELLMELATKQPDVRRILCSGIQWWTANAIVERGLVHCAIPKPGTTEQLMASLTDELTNDRRS